MMWFILGLLLGLIITVKFNVATNKPDPDTVARMSWKMDKYDRRYYFTPKHRGKL